MKLGKTEIEKQKFHQHRSQILLYEVGVDKAKFLTKFVLVK